MCNAVTIYNGEELDCMLKDGHTGDHYNFVKLEEQPSELQYAEVVALVNWNENGFLSPTLQKKGEKYVQSR